jgi:hypothetical protein
MWESRYLEVEPRPRPGASARALVAGLAGVVTVTALNEGGRRLWARAPRIELLGERAVARLARRAGYRPGERDRYLLALAGSILSDGAYFALAGLARRRPLAAGAGLGAAAGLGAVLLPGVLGLGARPVRRSPETAAATFAWYLAAGLAAGWASRAHARRREQRIARGR